MSKLFNFHKIIGGTYNKNNLNETWFEKLPISICCFIDKLAKFLCIELVSNECRK